MREKSNKNYIKKSICKRWCLCLIIVMSLSTILGSCGNEAHIYDDAQIKDVMNGLRTEKIGEYSIIETDSENVTLEALTDWYFNYVSQNDYNWCMILYTDKNDNSGVYAIDGIVQKDIIFEKDEYGDYSVGNSSNAIFYAPTEDNTLEESVWE